jgi:hypothetical protein
MLVRKLLRPRILAAIFGAYVLAIAVIAVLFANSLGSSYSYSPSATEWSYGVDLLLASILLLGLGTVAAVSRHPLEVLHTPAEIGAEPEPVGEGLGPEVVEYEEFDGLPPPLDGEPPGEDTAERDIDDLLSALGDMETSMGAEDGEGVEVGAVPANGSPMRDNSLPWWSTMLTRGPRLALRRLTESSPI